MIELQPTGSGGATSGDDSGGAVSADVNSGAAASGSDSGGDVSADIDSGDGAAWRTRYGSAMYAVCAQVTVLRFCRCVWIYTGRACDVLAQSFGSCDRINCTPHGPGHTWMLQLETKTRHPSRDTYDLFRAAVSYRRWQLCGRVCIGCLVQG